MQETSSQKEVSAQKFVIVNKFLVLENDRTLKGAVFNVLDIIKKYTKLDFKEQLALEAVYHDYKSGFNVKRIKGKMKKKELAGYIVFTYLCKALTRILIYN